MATIPPKPVLGEPRSAVTADGEVPWASAVVDALQAHDDDLVVLNALAIDDDGVTLVVTDSIRSVDMAAGLTQVAAASAPGAVAPTATQTLFAWDSTTELPIMVTPARAYTALTGFVDAAGQNQQAYRNQAGTFNVCSLKMPAAGKIIYVSVDQTAARTAGTATHTVYKNGTSTAITATIDGTNTTHVVGTAGSVAFAAGDLLDTRQSVSGYTGTAAYEATIWVQFDAS